MRFAATRQEHLENRPENTNRSAMTAAVSAVPTELLAVCARFALQGKL